MEPPGFGHLNGGGEIGRILRSHDWSQSKLGPPKHWPAPLRTAVALILNSGHPMYIWWAEDSLCLYNDAYRPLIGSDRHPSSIGQPAQEVWHEIWPVIGPQIDHVMAGRGATWHENQLIPITRNGRREDVYWTYSYSPIADPEAASGVGGVLVVCSETTALVRAEQSQQALNQQLARQSAQQEALLARLREHEAFYHSALAAGRMGAWEVDFLSGVRVWSKEGLDLFGLDLPDGLGKVGGEGDEFKRAMHPEDIHLQKRFHALAQTQDEFDAEYRIVRPDGKVLWVSGRAKVISRQSGNAPHRMVNVVADITDRKNDEQNIRLLMRETTHRSKNLLSVVQSIARALGRNAPSVAAFQESFTSRLTALARSYDLLVSEEWSQVDLEKLVRDHMSSFADERETERLMISGPRVALTPDAAQAIGLAMHELATNAVKYGAWSVPEGRVELNWALSETAGQNEDLIMQWKELGGPHVDAPTKHGFGTLVIDKLLEKSVDGSVTMDFEPTGFEWTLSMPKAFLAASKVEQGTD